MPRAHQLGDVVFTCLHREVNVFLFQKDGTVQPFAVRCTTRIDPGTAYLLNLMLYAVAVAWASWTSRAASAVAVLALGKQTRSSANLYFAIGNLSRRLGRMAAKTVP